MSPTQKFIKKYFETYLSISRKSNPFIVEDQNLSIPPEGEELAELISYLNKCNLQYAISGTLAVIKHLKLKTSELVTNFFRPISKVELVFSGELPILPPKWQRQSNQKTAVIWLSPLKGSVEFTLSNKFSSYSIDKESFLANCPILDIRSLFEIKLQIMNERDFIELIYLTKKQGIPTNLDTEKLNKKQKQNLNFIKQWIDFKQKKLQLSEGESDEQFKSER